MHQLAAGDAISVRASMSTRSHDIVTLEAGMPIHTQDKWVSIRTTVRWMPSESRMMSNDRQDHSRLILCNMSYAVLSYSSSWPGWMGRVSATRRAGVGSMKPRNE